jgi:hypothetical protein
MPGLSVHGLAPQQYASQARHPPAQSNNVEGRVGAGKLTSSALGLRLISLRTEQSIGSY